MAIFQNQATLTYNDNTVNSNIVTGEIVEVLSITKASLNSSYSTGDTVTYITSVINSGSTAFSGITRRAPFFVVMMAAAAFAKESIFVSSSSL